MNEIILSNTGSLCPECLQRLPAKRIAIENNVYLDKTCPDHGHFRTIIWRGEPSYQSWAVERIPSTPPTWATVEKNGCPHDCGLCSNHRQRTCCVLLEITQRCNLRCPVCFAAAGGAEDDADLETIHNWYQRLLDSGGPYNIQLSGGEPTMRDDLPEIISLGRSLGFTFFQLNTNGLRLADDASYLRKLKTAGLNCVFLQFDGMNDMVYQRIRGKDLLEIKKAAIARCGTEDLGVVLVPTLIPGVNISEIGPILRFAMENMPTVRGVHFQPVSYFGRYPVDPHDEHRITIPEVLNAIEQQTDGKMRVCDFGPPSAENAYCSFNGNFMLMESGEWKAWKKSNQAGCCCEPKVAAAEARKAQAFVAKRWSASQQKTVMPMNSSKEGNLIDVSSMDAFLERAEQYMLCISGMAFQDVWNVELERLQECFIHVVSPDAKIIPFCAYNLTDKQGKALYRQQRS